MNRVILIGRLTRDPEIRYAQATNMPVARYTLAVDRAGRRNQMQGQEGGQETADFIRCVAFDKTAEFAERYLNQGRRIAVEGRIQTGSYTNKDGQRVYTTEVIVDRHEFVDNKPASTGYQGGGSSYQGGGSQGNGYQGRGYQDSSYSSGQGNRNEFQSPADDFGASSIGDGFMNIPDGVEDEGLPFN